MLESATSYLAGADQHQLTETEIADALKSLERADSAAAAARGRLIRMFEILGGPRGDGQHSTGGWLRWETSITRAQAGMHKQWARRAEEHPAIIEAMTTGRKMSPSWAVKCCTWINRVPEEYRGECGQILAAAFQAGADEQGLARIAAELIERLAPPDPDGDAFSDRNLRLESTLDGAGRLGGDLSPECAAAVRAVLEPLAKRCGPEDTRTAAQRYHDALQEAMNRLLASGLLPKRGGAPVTALVHISFADLLPLDEESVLQDQWATWVAERMTARHAQWAGHRAADATIGGDGGAWISGPAAQGLACDAALFPVITGTPDLNALTALIGLCVQYSHLDPDAGRGNADSDAAAGDSGTASGAGLAADRQANARMMEELIKAIIGQAAALLSGPGGLASHLRVNLLGGMSLGGPSLPLDVGDTDEIPWYLRKAVDIRDQHCSWPSGCDRPAVDCQPHHRVHRADHGATSLANLGNLCFTHHHIMIHRMGWTLEVSPDGTSQARSPDGKRIKTSHQRPPPPRPG